MAEKESTQISETYETDFTDRSHKTHIEQLEDNSILASPTEDDYETVSSERVKECSTAVQAWHLAEKDKNDKLRERYIRHGLHLFNTAKELGWIDDGAESPLNYIARHEREQGRKQTVSDFVANERNTAFLLNKYGTVVLKETDFTYPIEPYQKKSNADPQ
jgi:hypothetical protein